MEFLSSLGISASDMFLFLGVLVLAVIIVAVGQTYWVTRIMISSFIALALVKILPESILFFESYSELIYFLIFSVLISAFCHYKLFDAVYWEGGRFDFVIIIFAFLILLFFVAVIFGFVEYSYFEGFFTEGFFVLLRDNFFWFAVTPIVWGLIFSKKM